MHIGKIRLINTHLSNLTICLKKQFFLSLIFLLMGFSVVTTEPVFAVELKNLYEIELSATEANTATQANTQAKLLNQAMQKVLIKLTASEKVLKNNVVIEALKKTDKYVKQFSYHQNAKAERLIKVVFNESMIKSLLKTAGEPLWEVKRPVTVVWLVMDKDNTLQWINQDSEASVISALEKSFNERGIPLVFPLLDLTDTEIVSEQNLAQEAPESLEALRNASKRYHADSILIGHLNHTSGWQGHWTLLMGENKANWNTADTKNEGLDILMNFVAENTRSSLIGYHSTETEKVTSSTATSQTTYLLVSVSGILSAEEYHKVLDYLQHLPLVSEVEVTQIMPEKTIFSLRTTSDKASVIENIQKDQMLLETPNDNTPSDTEVLSYKIAGAST